MFGETSQGETFADLSSAFSVYMCGHLHRLMWGKQRRTLSDSFFSRLAIMVLGKLGLTAVLHFFLGLGDVLQSYHPTHFLELEVGDMKQHGIYRIMVVDHDMISFTDISMPMTTIPSAMMHGNSRKVDQSIGQEDQSIQEEESSEGKTEKKKKPALEPRLPTNPIAVITNPKDSRYLIPKHEPVGRIGTSTHIRFLAWTDNQIPDGDHEYVRKDITIEIKIDGILHPHPARFAGTRAEDKTDDEEFLPLYVSEWNPQDYNDGKEHEIEIKIVDRFGRVGSGRNVFRVDGKRTNMNGGFGEWVMWANIAVLVSEISIRNAKVTAHLNGDGSIDLTLFSLICL